MQGSSSTQRSARAAMIVRKMNKEESPAEWRWGDCRHFSYRSCFCRSILCLSIRSDGPCLVSLCIRWFFFRRWVEGPRGAMLRTSGSMWSGTSSIVHKGLLVLFSLRSEGLMRCDVGMCKPALMHRFSLWMGVVGERGTVSFIERNRREVFFVSQYRI